jgi:hypothetical protein
MGVGVSTDVHRCFSGLAVSGGNELGAPAATTAAAQPALSMLPVTLELRCMEGCCCTACLAGAVMPDVLLAGSAAASACTCTACTACRCTARRTAFKTCLVWLPTELPTLRVPGCLRVNE